MRRTAFGASTALAVAILTGCGGSDEPASEPETTPVEPSTSSPAPSEAASKAPESTVTAKPLSPYEDERPVQVLRDWTAALALSINAGDEQLSRVAPLSTPEGLDRFVGYGTEDAGLFYPGPLPFTPTAVNVEGDRATVPVCAWVQGWAQKPATKQPARPKQIRPTQFLLVRSGGEWKVDDFIDRAGACGSVPVKGQGFE